MLKQICVICEGELPPNRQRYCQDICAKKGDAEVQRVKEHNNISHALGLPATLTIDEWLVHRRYFEGKCAYCQDRPATDLDHFIPSCFKGGTTIDNSAKLNHHPNMMPTHPKPRIPPATIAYIRAYLLRFAKT